MNFNKNRNKNSLKMRISLCMMYWSLLLISFLSSCLLFLIVASETTKLVEPNISEETVNWKLENHLSEGTAEFQLGEADESINKLPLNLKQSESAVSDKQSDIKEEKVPNSEITGSVDGDSIDTEQHKDKGDKGLSDIPATPAVITLTEKSPELLIDSIEDDNEDDIIPLSDRNTNQTDVDESSQDDRNNFIQDDFIILSDPKTVKQETVLPHEIPPDEKFRKIDDSGGTMLSEGGSETKENASSIENETATSTIPPITPTATVTPEVNITVEDNPIPVFSEWAQKQMEEAEKKLEKEAVNSSSMKKNTTTGSKPQILKIRAKNYASPDCGAKIIASNAEAQNTGALLTSSKDEYMLSPCTNRIWFVVELCEAIQAEKVDLANFELFSSSPKNFSVAVSNRFPTREWSNVGRFVADDQRNIQSFDLHPHLFGKFVRVDIYSHYNSEHFCPISLFRVYGTSEFEAFETENRAPSDDIDEFEDDFAVDQNNLNENNLFKSASDAVISIVKKAAEVLVKTNANKTEESDGNLTRIISTCFTPKVEFYCDKCSKALISKVNYLLSCKYYQLISLLNVELIRSHIISSQICANRFSFDTTNFENVECKQDLDKTSHLVLNERQSYILNLLPVDYIAALCQIVNTSKAFSKKSGYKSHSADTALNLTIDRKSGDNFINVEGEKKSKKIPKLPDSEEDPKLQSVVKIKENKHLENVVDVNSHKVENNNKEIIDSGDESEPTQIPQPPTEKDIKSESSEENGADSNVNIFNIVENLDMKSAEKDIDVDQPLATDKTLDESLSVESITANVEEQTKSKETDSESGTWESIDTLLSEQNSNENLNPPTESVSSNHQVPQRVHSESVFIRLSNRIKSLERNMSLSGQYLEELSRRYKKQVEELQHSFAKTLTAIEDQNRQSQEKEQNLIDENTKLRKDLEELTIKVNTWIGLIVCVGAFIVLQVIMSWLFLRAARRQHYTILRKYEDSCLVKRKTNTKKLIRRKSVEGVSGHPSPCHKSRRPSEEAMRITGSYKDLLILEEGEGQELEGGGDKEFMNEIIRKKSKQRQRKISVIYNGKQSQIFRQESAPGDFTLSTISTTTTSTNPDDTLILDEDYENYVPGSDLAYNEFMPEGPSGSLGKVQNGDPISIPKSSKKSSKIRRLSSPNFLKSPFSKNASSNKKLHHGPTGWEWYRSKKSDSKTSASSHQNGENSNKKKKSSSSPKSSIKVNGIGHELPGLGSDPVLNNSNGSDDSLRTSGTSTTTGSLLSNGKSSSKKHRSLKKILKKVF